MNLPPTWLSHVVDPPLSQLVGNWAKGEGATDEPMGRNGDADGKNRHVDMAGRGRGGMNWQIWMEIYIYIYIYIYIHTHTHTHTYIYTTMCKIDS